MIFTGEPPKPFQRFLGAYLRFYVHTFAYLFSVANLFPGFVGAPGSYPVDLIVPKISKQKRLQILFRLVLVLPALLLAVVLVAVLILIGIANWFVALLSARVTRGLRDLAIYILRYQAQVLGYGLLLLTDQYPYAGPLLGDITEGPKFVRAQQLLPSEEDR